MARSVARLMMVACISLAVLLAGCSGDDGEDSSPDSSQWTDAAQLEAALEAVTDAGTAAVAFAGARLRLTSNAVAQQLGLDDCRDRLGTWSTTPPSSQPLLPDVVCLQAPRFLEQPTAPDAASLEDAQPVVCEELHDIDRYLTFDARPGNGTEYPGQIFLSESAATQCDTTFEEAFGVPAVSDPSTYVAIIPDASAWPSGERQITCVRLDPDGGQLERSDSNRQTQED